MNTYLVCVYGKLFTVQRVVLAESKTAAAAQVEQDGARSVWIVENPVIED